MLEFFKMQNDNMCLLDPETTCVSDPVVNALKEILLTELRQLSYYLLKLKEFNIENQIYKDTIIESICAISFQTEINREEFKEFLVDIINKRCDAEHIYIKYCEQNNLDCQILKSYTSSCENFNFLDAIKLGEKQSIQKNIILDKNRKDLYEILFYLIRNACLNLNELKKMGTDLYNHQIELIKLLSSTNFKSTSIDKIKSRINKFSLINLEIEKKLIEEKIKKFGEVTLTDVNFQQIHGKSILVTGKSLIDLYNLLLFIENEDIKVYTNDYLILAHTYPEFRKFKNLVGHFQKSYDNPELDFSSFPGPIFITQYASGNYTNVIRGIVYTNNILAGKGFGKIKNNNFTPLIKAANNLPGFKKDIKINSIKVGYDINFVNEQLDKLGNKIEKKDIKNIIFIGLLNSFGKHSIYFDKFLDEIPNDTFVISLSYKRTSEHILHIDSYYDYDLTYKILETLENMNKTCDININMILTEYNISVISHIFDLKYNYKINNIFLDNIVSQTINPSTSEVLVKLFNVKMLTNDAKKDLDKMLND